MLPSTARIPVAALFLYAALVGCAGWISVSMPFGSSRVSFTWSEAALVIGLATLPPSWLVLCTAVAATATQISRRVSRSRVILNASAVTLGTAAASAVSAVIAGTLTTGTALPLHSLRGVLAAVVAAVAFSMITGLAVSAAIAFLQGMTVRRAFLDDIGQQTIVCGGNIGVALAVIGIYHWDRRLLLAIPPILYAVHSAYRHRLSAQAESTTWEQLEKATRTLVRLDEREVAQRAVASARELFRADDVEVVVHRADGSRLKIGGDEQGAHSREEHHRAGQPEWMILCTTLEDGPSVIGELRLCFRGNVTLTDRERASLATFASALSAALNNASLHETTRELAQLKAHEAAHDSLTGLSNRSLLFERGEEALAAVASGASQVALLLLDLDHFKEINDTLGHDAGDQLLQAVAARLSALIGPADTAARLGGDEFALLLTNLADAESAMTVAARLLTTLNTPVVIEGLRLPVEGSIGVACAPTDATSIRELLRCADVAMYRAKSTGATAERYDSAQDGGDVDRLLLMDELREALDTGQLLLHYQPKFDLSNDWPMGAEALVRWRHPRRGLLAPADFMSVVEHSGLVRRFTLHVLRLALAECAEWARLGAELPVAVNLSTRNLLDPDLPADVRALLEHFGVPGHRLVIEITETVAMSELDVVETVLAKLRALGVQLSVDDFGTGYSSLTFLSRVTVHEVKIDRSFVSTMLTAAGDAAIVRATIELAHSFGMRVIAEGVETPEHKKALTAMGCDGAQGYHLGVPMPSEEIRMVLGRIIVLDPALADAALTPIGPDADEPTPLGVDHGSHIS